jgi:hypothetical protein
VRGSSAAPRLRGLLFLGVLVIALSGCVERRESPPRATEPIGPIWGSHIASQTFTGRPLPLVGLDLQLATYDRVNQGTVTLVVFPTNGPLAVRSGAAMVERVVTIPASELQDNAVYRFRFASSNLAEAVPSWTFSVSSSAERPDDAIAVWASASDVIAGGSASYDGQPRDANLVFTPVYAEPLPRAAGVDIGRALVDFPKPLIPLALVFLPGLLLAQFFVDRERHGFGLQLMAAPAFGLAAAPLLLLYTTVLGFHLSFVAVWAMLVACAVGILVFEVVHRRRAPRARDSEEAARGRDWSVVIAVAAALAGLLMRGVALQDGPVPPGADTYHHALIAQLIADNGQIPSSYRPYADINSFSYHFGFHALAGLDALATGDGGIAATAAVAPLVSVLAALSTFFLVRVAGLGRTAAAVAAVVLALVDPFPVALLDIGRYPQLAALVILPVALAFALGYVSPTEVGRSRPATARVIVGGAVLLAAVFLTHYRVILYLVIILTLFTGWGVARAARAGLPAVWRVLQLPVIISVVALVLCAPWLVRLAASFSLGLGGSGGQYAPAYYAIDRLGSAVSHPAVLPLAIIAVLGVGLAAVSRQPLILVLAAALAIELGLSNPYWLALPGAGWVDTVTVVSSAFVAVAVSIGFLTASADRLLTPWVGRHAHHAVVLGAIAAAVWGGLQLPPLIDPGHRLVGEADRGAATWISSNTPSDARFLVNTFVLHWQPDFVAPTDAGYFLPLLARRPTTLLPMVYAAERGAAPEAVERMEAIARASAQDPASPAAIALMRAAAVRYVYLGLRRGPIAEYRLATSPAFRRVYQQGGVSVYELLPTGSS